MKRRSVVTDDQSGNWLVVQWSEAVRALQSRPESRRGQTVISDEALESCLKIVTAGKGHGLIENDTHSIALIT